MANNSTSSKKAHKKKEVLRRSLIVLLGFGISGFCLWYVFGKIEFDKVVATASRIRIVPLIASIAVYWLLAIVARAFLIRHLLSPIGHVPLSKAYRYICIGFLGNNLLPLKMGELVRIGGIARTANLGFTSVAGSLVLERIFDLTMTVLIGIAATQVAPLPAKIRLSILIFGILIIVFLGVFKFLTRHGLKEAPSPKTSQLKALVWNLLVRFTSGLGTLNSAQGMVRALFFSTLIWSFAIAAYLLRLTAFGLPPSLPMVLVLLTALSVGVSLPSAPAYVGVYHAFAAWALILLGVDNATAVGFAVFCHLVDVIMTSILGAISMILEGLGWHDLSEPSARK